jgi:orotidine-5'-phosphate decarboxylase
MLNPHNERTELRANSVPNHCLIGALDNSDVDILVDRIKKWRLIRWWKIGHQAIACRQSTRLINCLHDTDCNIFMDIKLWDTPRTVMATIKAYGENNRIQALSLGDDCITQDAADLANSYGIKLWAIVNKSSAHGAGRAMRADVPCAGIITASPNFYRYGDKYSDREVIVPAVRLPWQSNDDHPKVWTPWAAIEAGADYIVVGRTLADPWWQENIRFGEHRQPDSASTRVETALIGPRDSNVEAD